MMNQQIIISNVCEQLADISASTQNESAQRKIQDILQALHTFQLRNIDYKSAIDHLTDGILISDATGMVLYINNAFAQSTHILPEEILNHKIQDLQGQDRLYTGGVIQEIITTHKSAFRLCTTYKTDPPLRGYLAGTPIFNENVELHLIVVCHRSLITLRDLQSDFQTFLQELRQVAPNSSSNPDTNDNSIVSSENIMIGKNGSLANIWNLIRHIAPTDATVLITGESGAGKEVVADEIFQNSARKNEPCIKINCASIPADLLESELFGYEKGAFSGANPNGKKGLFEQANHGTLMLDEIGDMPMELQVKLLRAIQQQEITRVGGSHPIKLDIRFIALTNSNLKEKIVNGTFRQDLYYRLNVIPIYVPPLRERLQDLEALCNTFIRKYTEKYHCAFAFTNQQLNLLKTYHWPGNIRELENIIEYVILCSAGEGTIEDSVLSSLLNLSLPPVHTILDTDFYGAVEQFEKQLIEEALTSCGSLRKAAKKLNLNPSTVSRKIKLYNILPPPDEIVMITHRSQHSQQ